MRQERLKNDKRGWDVTANKLVLYSWVEKHGAVCRADGKCVGNHLSGDFLLKAPEKGTTPLMEKQMPGMYWKVQTIGLLNEIMNNPGTSVLFAPMNIFRTILAQVAERALIVNDPELNLLMCRLALYENGNPGSKDYDPKIWAKCEEAIKKHNSKKKRK